jgi:hypothetical protein
VVVLVTDAPDIRKECQIRGVLCFQMVKKLILDEISSPSQNMETVILEKHQELQFILLKGSNFGMMRLHLF